MAPSQTYELVIASSSSWSAVRKDVVEAWLQSQGVEAFVEGTVDGLDLDTDYEHGDSAGYDALGGGSSALLLYSFDETHLSGLASALKSRFAEDITAEIRAMDTSLWQEGWKEGFKPLTTERFFIHPPWEPRPSKGNAIPITIEPGMAFGTGQHETTRLCLEFMETLPIDGERLLDVGTGTGILSIAAVKLGATEVTGVDIEPDAVIAARANAQANDTNYRVLEGSLPHPEIEGLFDIVVSNMILPAQLKVLPEAIKMLAPGGTLILAGILVEQEAELASVLSGFDIAARRTHSDWLGLRCHVRTA